MAEDELTVGAPAAPQEEDPPLNRSGFDSEDAWVWGPPEDAWAGLETEVAFDLPALRDALGTSDISFNGTDPRELGPKEIRADVDPAVLEQAVAAHDPVFLEADRWTVPADGSEVAVVTYRRRPDRAPVAVTFTVNGQQAEVATTAGVAELRLRATAVGPLEVTCEGKTIVIEALGG